MHANLSVDHVVIRVDELPQAIADYRALGFTVVLGGEHPGLGSRNALIAFRDDTYLELISFDSPRRIVPRHIRTKELASENVTGMRRHVLPWETAPEGLIDFALVPDSIAGAISAAKDRGLQLDGPISGGRKRPDGVAVKWQLALPDCLELPFLCADETPRALRVPDGESRVHENQATGIGEILVAVASLPASIRRYRMLLGLEPAMAAGHATFVLKTTAISLVEQRDIHPMHNDVAQCEEGVFAIRLITRDSARGGRLDVRAAHEAEIEFVVPYGGEPAAPNDD